MDVPLHQALRGQGHVSRSGEVALEVSTEGDAPGPDVRLHHGLGGEGHLTLDGDLPLDLSIDPE